jgi:hypothetical protein
MKRYIFSNATVLGFSFVVLGIGVSEFAWAQDKNGKNVAIPAGGGAFVTLTDGGVTVSVNSFGRAGQPTPACAAIGTGFNIDEPGTSVLCEHTDFFSTGGPVKTVSPSGGCTITNPITADAPNHATSTVQCGDCTMDFDQTVDDTLKAWTTVVAVTGCPLACYYSYTDYDVHGFADNGGVFHPAEGGFLGQFVVRNNGILPDVHYLFTDQSAAVHWDQREFPGVRTFIEGLTMCTDLSDGPPTFVGDWTGALQYSFDPVGDATVSYSHRRDDTVPFP